MKPIHEEPEQYDNAVSASAQALITRFGKTADNKAWEAARMPNLTRSERAYCEAVATRVTRLVRGESLAV
jgi:hypothetical protein